MRSKRGSLSSFSNFFSEWSRSLPDDDRKELERSKAAKRVQGQFASLVAPSILDHVNAVYLLSPDKARSSSFREGNSAGTAYSPVFQGSTPLGTGSLVPGSTLKRKHLIVYVDNSLVSAELNAQRELIRLKYLTECSVELTGFEIKLSRGAFKEKHPFREEVRKVGAEPSMEEDLEYLERVSRETLSDEDRAYIDESTSVVKDRKLREALKRAMTASYVRDRKKTEKDKN